MLSDEQKENERIRINYYSIRCFLLLFSCDFNCYRYTTTAAHIVALLLLYFFFHSHCFHQPSSLSAVRHTESANLYRFCPQQEERTLRLPGASSPPFHHVVHIQFHFPAHVICRGIRVCGPDKRWKSLLASDEWNANKCSANKVHSLSESTIHRAHAEKLCPPANETSIYSCLCRSEMCMRATVQTGQQTSTCA